MQMNWGTQNVSEVKILVYFVIEFEPLMSG